MSMRSRLSRWLVPAVAALAVLVVIAVVWQQRPGASGGEPGAGGAVGGDGADGAGGGQGVPPYAGPSPGDDDALVPLPEPPTDPSGGPGGDFDNGTIAAIGYHLFSGTRLGVIYTNGVPECYGTAGVPLVEETPEAVTVTIPRTMATVDKDVACIDIAVVDYVEVTLDSPVGDRSVLDGSRGGAKLSAEPLPGADPAT